MPYNYILVEGSDVTGVIKYSELALQSTMSDQDQLQVFRLFDTSKVSALVSSPLKATESYAARSLPKLGESGSTMYSVNEGSKTITMSTNVSDYTWEDVNHHSRGSDIDLPVASAADTIIIVRKTDAKALMHTWLPSDYLISSLLKGNDQQILNVQQEVLSRDDLINKLEHAIDTANGIASLDTKGIVPDSLFPTGIGGSGTFTDNLAGTRIETFADVLDTLSVGGATVEYLTGYTSWVPSEPFRYLENLNRRVDGGILRWQTAPFVGWGAKPFKINYLSDVQAKIDLSGGGEESPNHGHILEYKPTFPSHKKWSVSGLPNDTTPTKDGEVLFWNTVTAKWEASSEMIDEVPEYVFEEEKFWLADMLETTGSTWVTFTDGSDWENRPEHPGGYTSGGNGVSITSHPRREASVFGWDSTSSKWVSQPFNLHRCPNFWAGSATETDVNDPSYTNGKVGNNKFRGEGEGDLWESYELGDVPIWDATLPGKNGTLGAFRVGKLFSWDPVVVADQEAAPEAFDDNDPPAGLAMPVSFDNSLRIKQLNLDNIGLVTTSGVHAPQEGTYLYYNKADNMWYPREYAANAIPVIYRGNVVVHYQETYNAITPIQFEPKTDIVIPFNGTLTQYKLLDCWKILTHFSDPNNYTFLEPGYNNWQGGTFDIPWGTGFPPFEQHWFDDGWAQYWESGSYFGQQDIGCNICKLKVDVQRVRVTWSDEGSDPTESVSNIVINADGSESGSWTTANTEFLAGDILRFRLKNYTNGGLTGLPEGMEAAPGAVTWADTGYADALYDFYAHNFVGKINGLFKITPT